MHIPEEFNEIRPYTPEELPQVIEELLADPSFRQIVTHVLPEVTAERLTVLLHSCKTNLDVQKAIFYPLLHKLISQHTDGFDMDCSSLPDRNANYTFVSNHRDIVLDPGLISVGLLDNGFSTTVEIAIGDNLLIYPWIKKLVRVNKSFIVQRAPGIRQMLEASARLSRYIHFALTSKHENVWIAQREGRAKDSNDLTQESVMKMLTLGGEGTPVERLEELHIVPTALSYEYDPCDYLKAAEMQLKRDVKDYKKSQADDLLNMQTGIFGYKGRVHFQTASCIDRDVEALRDLPRNEFFSAVTRLVDRGIHANYRLYPGNYVACDLLSGDAKFAAHYTPQEKQQFEEYIAKKMACIELPVPKDEAFLHRCLLTMYANPVLNRQKALHE